MMSADMERKGEYFFPPEILCFTPRLSRNQYIYNCREGTLLGLVWRLRCWPSDNLDQVLSIYGQAFIV